MSNVVSNCNLIKYNFSSIVSKIESAEDYLRYCQNSLSEGVVVSGTSLSGDTIDNVLLRLSNVKAQANNLYNKCNTIITEEQNLSSNSSSSKGGSSSEPPRSGGRDIYQVSVKD